MDLMDLIEFLRARLAEDERMARGATPGPWRHNPEKHHHIQGTPLFEEAVFAGMAAADAICVAGTGETDDPQSMADAAHIARHDPARVLRQSAALRAIVDHARALDMTTGATSALRDTLRDLAAIWADHPDYRPEWQLGEAT